MENLAYKEEIWEELLDGTPVAMSPRPAVNHTIVSGNIFYLFNIFLQNKPCMPFSDGVDVHLTKKDTVIPDAMIVCNSDIIKTDGIYGAPDLIVEVLSPSTAKRDKGYKKSLYEKCGVKEYWIVDIENRSVEIYTLLDNSYVLADLCTILPQYMIDKMTDVEKSNIKTSFSPVLFPELVIDINDIFRRVFR